MHPMFWFTGVVEDRNDPEKLGRIRVRIFGMHTDDITKISTEDLPWSHVMMPVNSASITGVGISPTGIVEGSWVVGFFADGQDAQDPIIIGTLPGKSTQLVEELKAFKDPLGKFPRWYNETDVSKVAREETWKDHQSYADRYVSRVTAVEKATAPALDTTTLKPIEEDRQTWDEPEPRDGIAGLYPYVHTYETESGIVKEYDDTPSASRIVEYHPAGSFYEIYPDGKKMTKVVGDNYEIIIKDDNVLIRGNSNITVEGDCRQLVKGDYTLEVVGNYNVKVHGDRNTKITKNDSIEIVGNFNKNVKENMIQRIGVDQTLLVDGNKTETIAGTSSLMVTGAVDNIFLDTMSTFSNGAQSLSTNSTQQFLSKDGLEFGSQSNWNLKCNANMTIETVGTFNIQSSGNFSVTAPRIDWN